MVLLIKGEISVRNLSTKKIVYSGFFLALGIVLPFLTGQIPSIGSMLLPMHIPVLICGFVLGWPYGLIVGFITPILRSAIFTMPPMYPSAIAMAFELATYGLATGIFYKTFPKKNVYIYVTLLISMLMGRVVWGIVSLMLFRIQGNPFTVKFFMTGAFINAIPGIILQIVLIPALIYALKKGNLIENE
jgi:thiamine transporter ThiT